MDKKTKDTLEGIAKSMLSPTKMETSLRCLNCGSPADAASHAEGRAPKKGDITICLYCGHWMEFDENLQLVQPSDEAIVAMAGNPEILLLSKLSGLFREWLKAKKDKEKDIPSGE